MCVQTFHELRTSKGLNFKNLKIKHLLWIALLISVLARMKVQWDGSGGGTLLGCNTGGGAVMLLTIMISVSSVLPCISMHNCPWVYSVPTSVKLDLPGCTCCLIWGVSVGACNGERRVYVSHLELWLSIDVPLRTNETLLLSSLPQGCD
jgi:hypothetical protein